MLETPVRVEEPSAADTATPPSGDRAVEGRRVRAWVLAWFGAVALGMANGAIRQVLYADALGELRAHQVSTVTLLVLLAVYLWAVDRRWPIPTLRFAIFVGAFLALMTIAFEVVFGMYLRPDPLTLAEVMHDYDVTDGRVWAAIPIFLAAGPPLMWWLRVGGRGRA